MRCDATDAPGDAVAAQDEGSGYGVSRFVPANAADSSGDSGGDGIAADSVDIDVEGPSSQGDGSGGGSAADGGSVASIPLDMPRRSLQLTFTCGKCGAFPMP